jgi:predicted nucleic acid-binding protein
MIIDTDVLVDILRGHRPALTWFSTLTERPRTSGFCALELVSGCRTQAEVRKTKSFLADLVVIWPTEADLERSLSDYAALRHSKGLGVLDALIATTAVGLGVPIMTFNSRHFSTVTGLQIDRPYDR